MFIDGLIAVCIVFLCFWENTFGGDEAAKYISGGTLFILKNTIGSLAVTLVGLQSFRSQSYSKHQQAKSTNEIQSNNVTQSLDTSNHS